VPAPSAVKRRPRSGLTEDGRKASRKGRTQLTRLLRP